MGDAATQYESDANSFFAMSEIDSGSIIKMFSEVALIAGVLLHSVRSSYGLKYQDVPNGPLGAPSPENIKLYYDEPVPLRPGGGHVSVSATKPEYGGKRQWRYSGPDITEMPEGAQGALQEAGKLPVWAVKPGQVQASAPPVNFPSVNFPIPPWLSQLINTAAGISSFITTLGVPGAPNVMNCSSSPALKELMACVQITVTEGKELFQTGKYVKLNGSKWFQPNACHLAQEIAVLNTRVMSGGRPADAALARLKTVASRPLAKTMMKVLGTTMMCTILMQKELTPDRQRWQAGSIVTTVTDLPVASDINDTKSGGFGHVNVILPRPSRVHRSDRIIEQLGKGFDPADTLYGGLGVEGRTDSRYLRPIP